MFEKCELGQDAEALAGLLVVVEVAEVRVGVDEGAADVVADVEDVMVVKVEETISAEKSESRYDLTPRSCKSVKGSLSKTSVMTVVLSVATELTVVTVPVAEQPTIVL